MTYEAIITLSLAVLALALKPGPGMMMVMSQTMARGISALCAFMGGFLIVTLIYLMVAIIGFHFVGVDMLFISILMKSMAAMYLIWFGIKGLQTIELRYDDGGAEEQSLFDVFIGAIVLTISNPLVIVFYAGILPTLVDVSALTVNDIFTIVGVVMIIEGAVPFSYCIPLALFRKKIPIKFLKGLRVFSSMMMIVIGLYIGYTAIGAQDLLSVF